MNFFGPLDFPAAAVAILVKQEYLMLTVLTEEALLALNTFSYSHMRPIGTIDRLSICLFTPLGTQI